MIAICLLNFYNFVLKKKKKKIYDNQAWKTLTNLYYTIHSDFYTTLLHSDVNYLLSSHRLKWPSKVEQMLEKVNMGGENMQALLVSYYLNHADHIDKWLKHKPAEKTNKTLFS